MERIFTIALALILPLSAQAEGVFEWPENFTVTDHETHPGTDDPPFINIFHKQGRNARNDIVTPIMASK